MIRSDCDVFVIGVPFCGHRPTTFNWYNTRKDETMTDPKPDLEKFDPAEWAAGEKIDIASAVLLMLHGCVVYNDVLGTFYRGNGSGWKMCLWGSREWKSCEFGSPTVSRCYDNGGWCKAVRKPKPEPVKPAEPSAEEILNALKFGERVRDADGDWISLRITTADPMKGRPRFPLSIPKPEPKPRRRVTREDAIVAMVKDPDLRVWDQLGTELRFCVRLSRIEWHNTGINFWDAYGTAPDGYYYLDPPK